MAKGKDKQPITNKVLTNALVYLPEDAVEELADIAEAHKDAITVDFTGKEKAKDKPESALKGKIDRILIKRNGVINLFGRMLAEIDQADVDGAVQVAHAFTTHTTEVELDYFAAVDDVTAARNDETGSGHMGTAEFSTGTLYRFATVDLKELTKNLSDDSEIAVDAARELAGQFLLSFIESLPQAEELDRSALAPAPGPCGGPVRPPAVVRRGLRGARTVGSARRLRRALGGRHRRLLPCRQHAPRLRPRPARRARPPLRQTGTSRRAPPVLRSARRRRRRRGAAEAPQ
ncbi:hypothetical protein SCALM49S_05745 [Streptomyces californicus]